jgi:hypothetical protein
MSRFFCAGLFDLPELRAVDYYWRLDADSVLLAPVPYDIFARLADAGKQYGYMVVTKEEAVVVKGLWNTTQAYLDAARIQPTFLRNHVRSPPPPAQKA